MLLPVGAKLPPDGGLPVAVGDVRGAFEKPGSGGLMERLIWEINNLGGTVTCVSDQWVRVDTVGVVKGTQVETHIEADTFLLALAETFRWWREFVTAT